MIPERELAEMTRLWRWQTNQVSVTETFSLGIKDIISPKSEKRTLTLPTSIDLDNLYENYHLIFLFVKVIERVTDWNSQKSNISNEPLKHGVKIKNNYSSPHPTPLTLE